MKTVWSVLVVLLLVADATNAGTIVTNIAASEHSLFIESDGSLWAMGSDSNGQLGDGRTGETQYLPEQIIPGNVMAIAAGAYHSLFLKSDGSVWGMGINDDGELGISLGFNSMNFNVPTPQPIISDGVAIAAGRFHSLVLKSDGSLWATGDNDLGQLGDGGLSIVTNVPEEIVSNGVIAISAGDWHSLFLKSDGSLWGMGDNGSGELGDGTRSNSLVPEQIVSSGVVAIAAGDGQSLFIKADGSLWAMGYNAYGQLGDGTETDSLIPEQIVSSNVIAIAAGYGHSLFLKSDGSLWAMGLNNYGELGDGTTISRSIPKQIVASNVVAVAAGSSHSLFLKMDGSLWAMGSDVLGDGFNVITLVPEQVVPVPPPVLDAPVLVVGNASVVTKISAGTNYSMFIRSDGSLWAMGDNSWGELGDGTSNNPVASLELIFSGVGAVSVSAGYGQHTLVLQTNGSLWATGDNSWGELGDGTYQNTNRLEQIISNGVVAVAAGGALHSLFLKSNGSLWGMGYNGTGCLGIGFGVNETNRPTQIVSSGVAAIAAGAASFSLFIKTNGSLWAMGYNYLGQLGDGKTNTSQYLPEQIVASNVTAVAAGNWHSLFLKTDGSLWGMGYNLHGALGNGNITNQPLPVEIVSNSVTAIAAGGFFSLFLKTDGSLWAMGYNRDGELGDGSFNDTNRPEQIVAGGVIAISAGGSHSLFVKSDGTLWGMGDNDFGELGPGTSSPVPRQLTGQAGDLLLQANCLAGSRIYYLLASTNVGLPLNQWTPILTNTVSVRRPGNFSTIITNIANSGATLQVYILETQ